MVNFLSVLGNTWYIIGYVPLLNNIATLNMVRCSWGSEVPSYGSKVLGRQKPSGKGIDIMNSEKG